MSAGAGAISPVDGEQLPGTFRALGAIARLTFKADPVRALISVLPGVALLQVVPAWLSKMLIDGVLAADRSAVWGAALLTAAAGLVGIVLALSTFQVSMHLREKVSLELDRRLIHESAALATVEHFERPAYADRMELLRMHRDSLIGGIVALGQGSQMVVMLVATLVLLGRLHPLLLLLPVAGIPTLLVAGRTQRNIEAVIEATAETDRRALHLFDVATGPASAKELRVFGIESAVGDRYHAAWTDVDDRRTSAWIRANFARGAASLLFACAFLGAIALVLVEAVAGRATIGDVVMATALAARINGSVEGTAGMIAMTLNVGRSMARFLWLVDHAAVVGERTRPRAGVVCPARLRDGISLEDVGFEYPGGKVALAGVNLHLPAGATVAVVGENGAGKSTLVKLLCRFYDPTAGTIRVDGIDLRDIPVDEWRAHMAAGYQDFARFELVAREVVGVGDLSQLGDPDAARAALDRAAAGDVLDALPGGLDSQLGATFGGHDLSGGQWQKLALGRALMRAGPLLLVLDEPTAAIDAETEHRLFERYAAAARLTAQQTGGVTVLVSHRFSTVRMADLIVVVADGTVCEVGAHAELAAAGGLYAELYELQARSYR